MLTRMLRARVVLALGLMLMVLLVLACTKEVEVEVVKEVVVEATAVPTLARYQADGMRLGFVHEAPYGFIDDAGNCTGLDIEVSREAGRRLGIDVVCVHISWEGLIPAVMAGRVDNVPVSMEVTPVKCDTVAYTDPYHTMGIGALVKKGNPKNLHSFEDFLKEGVVVAGSIGAEAAIARESFGVPEERVLAFAEQGQALEALKTGRADAVVYTIVYVNRYYNEKGKSEGLEVAEPFKSPSYYNTGHLFRNQEKEFVELWNDTLIEMKKDGFIAEELVKWGWSAKQLLGPEYTIENCCDFDDGRHVNRGCLPS